MLPLFDMMMRAQNGAVMDAFTKQFGLAQEQAAQAMAALMPAFSSGLKRSSANPYDFTALWQAMSAGNYASYFENVGKAFTPQGIADGNAMIERIFGSNEVAREIAAQVAKTTGIAQDIIRQMMPPMADMVMGGLLKQTMDQAMGQFRTTAPGSEAVTEMMQPWLKAMGMAPKPPAPSAADFGNPFIKMFQDWMAVAAAANPAAAPPPPAPDKPPFNAIIDQMFDSGLDVQKTYQKNLEAIFDTYMKRPETKD